MEGSSPYGEVCGVAIRGTEQHGEKRVLIAVTLVTDEEAGLLPMRVARDSPRTEVTWDGVSTLKFTATLRNGQKVTGIFICVHEADDETHTLEVCVALTFHPHGWIRFERSHLILNREDVLKLHIPLSVIEENMFSNMISLPDIERLYGISLADKHKEDENGARNVATYRELPWAKRQATGQRALPTLARVRAEHIRAEERHIAETLEPKWRERVCTLVVSLLRNRRRTLAILRQWHAYPMFQNRKPHEIWSLFMEAVLYSPLRLHITQTALFLFQETALAIPLTWLNEDERIIASAMVVARKELFRSVTESRTTAQYTCKEFRLNSLLDKFVCRNFVVHLFVSDCVAQAVRKGSERPTLLLVTIEAAGRCWVKHKDNSFLYYLKRALEKRTVVQDVAHMGMYVTIGDCVPSYTYQAPDRTKPVRLPCWTPK